MSSWAGAIFSLVFCSVLSAQPAHLFIGAAGQWQAVGLHTVHEGMAAAAQLDDAGVFTLSENGSGLGAQIECGIARSFWSVALGINHHSMREHDERTYADGYSYSHWETSEQVTNDRLLLGVRLSAFDHDPNPVKPLIGIGCSWGWMKRMSEHQNFSRHGDQVSWSIDESVTQKSKGSFGLAFELGLITFVQRAASISCLGRLEWYDLSLESKSSDSGMHSMPDVTGVHVATLQLGLQYYFRRD